MPIKNKFFAIIIVSLFCGLNANASLCNNNYYPVCGENGVTYQNSCKLKEAGQKMLKFGTCSSNNDNIQKPDLTQKNEISEAQNRINVFLDKYFKSKNKTLNGKMKFIDSLVSQIPDVKGVTQKEKTDIKNALLKYKNNLIQINNLKTQEEEERTKTLSNKENNSVNNTSENTENAEDDDEIKQDEKNTEDIEDNNEEQNKYITENTADKVDILRINYIKDKIGVRALGGARITAFNIIGKSENSQTGITDNYTIIVSEEYYEDDDGNIHVGVQTITPAIIKTKITEKNYEIIGHSLPRGGNLYQGDVYEMFPDNFSEKLQKDADYFQEKVKELQEINLKNAKNYFDSKK